jgi:tryptophan halogenase
MGGGTVGWISALYFLNKSKNLNLNLNIKIISSNDIEPIGVGEGTTPIFTNFIEDICKIDKKEFLRETKGSFKYGIKFDNWNFDDEYYYHLFSLSTSYETSNKDLDYDFIQYAINEELNISQKVLQKKIIGSSFDLLENNKISLNINSGYAYHFSANLIIPFLKKKCLEFNTFEYIEETIKTIYYDENGFIQKILTEQEQKVKGDFFVNCLGFKSIDILNEEYFNIKYWDKYILNNSAFAIQVKNSRLESLEPYTTATAQEFGWSWKIPQYEKTGYGYVYSSDFINNEDKLYDNLIKTYKIKENNIFKTKIIKSKPYYNIKQLHKNCLSLGLASGFVEPLEATSIHMSLMGLDKFFDMVENKIELNQKYINIFNSKLEKNWENVFKFIIFHYFTNKPINDYWKHYKKIQEDKIFDFYEKYQDYNNVFSKFSYYSISLGMKMKDFYYNFSKEKYLKNNILDYLKIETNIYCTCLYSHNEVLNDINQEKNTKLFNYS